MPERIDEAPVLTWERVAATFRDVASPYWIGVLDEALCRYHGLAAQPSSGENCDARITGQDIYDRHRRGDATYTWMGRGGGIGGPKLQEDVETRKWRTQKYEVRHDSLCNNRNWFAIADFIKKIES